MNHLKAPESCATAVVSIVRKGAWSTVAADGYPNDRGMFFCWAEGFDDVVILEFWPADEREEYKRAPCFGDDCGVWKEITHYRRIEYPAKPVIDQYTLVMTPAKEA